ncbi:Fe2+-enterobactin ABC transporter substrate-binding protein [Protaetiibacter larvae]|uniref:Fe2+-enterobactin ABC transporter substrate-binding protein n=1 Tax=Protaetiibacter larvae TaxID=2592654 RepID=A0A5C1YCM4_9MICO|nr:Fe2+-enterobactin ABC transporter substrate-binding protein [Protaetiibacter larvae]QEO10582.1 Fe2+-enterobactin ABC transporter substrate-binding protein [Protaetiibacter larvae]
MSRPTLRAALAVALAAGLALSGCAPTTTAPGERAAADESWPRVIEHELGETEIPAKPVRIVSTSLTLTGTLLAIGAPVVASSATSPGGIADDNGFFAQWSDAAADAGVEVLYPDLEFDEEAVIAAEPDLIVVSTTGADSTADQYEALSEIAPTIVLDYGADSWQLLAEKLGEATGLEEQAAQLVESFDAEVARVAGEITVPEGTANAVVFSGAEYDLAFAKPQGAHAQLLTALGFTVEGAPDEFDTSEQPRNDFAFVSLENSAVALTGQTVFLVSGEESDAEALAATPVFANAPAVTSDGIVPLGATSFRIDYYSALGVVAAIEKAFA